MYLKNALFAPCKLAILTLIIWLNVFVDLVDDKDNGLAAWRYQANTWIKVDLSPRSSNDNALREISQ